MHSSGAVSRGANLGLRMQSDAPTIPSNAEKLVAELKDELPQLFDMSYTPKWGLYSDTVQCPSFAMGRSAASEEVNGRKTYRIFPAR